MIGRRPRVLYIEPFEAGSHAQFGRTLRRHVDADWTCLTLPGRHWKWRARGSAVWFARAHAATLRAPFDVLLASAYLPLADLLALHPGLAQRPRWLYFHENQLAYPVRDEQTGERDFHFGFTQLVSALAATRCFFNSAWNRDSFLNEGARLLSRLPDAVPEGWIDDIRARSEVLAVPLDLPAVPLVGDEGPREAGPIVLWNHRWEYDKDPEAFFGALFALAEQGVPFRVAVCGERFRKAPTIFAEAQVRLAGRVVHWGHLADRAAYEALLGRCHLAVSTARHEFFGVAALEAAHFGARPLVPDRLAYPETMPAEYRYAEGELVPTLAALCRAWTAGALTLRADRRALTAPFGAPLLARYRALIAEACDAAEGDR
ncbi:MAG: DUF3524 domain-containing protein [Myxococcales bacterium]|nr:DUF3524 domain-containing protein [Myxococcales bacterium]